MGWGFDIIWDRKGLEHEEVYALIRDAVRAGWNEPQVIEAFKSKVPVKWIKAHYKTAPGANFQVDLAEAARIMYQGVGKVDASKAIKLLKEQRETDLDNKDAESVENRYKLMGGKQAA